MAWLRRHVDALSWLCIGLLCLTLIVVEGARPSAVSPSATPTPTQDDTAIEWLSGPFNLLNPLSPMNPSSPISGGR